MKITNSYSSIWATAIITLLNDHALNGYEIAHECGMDLDAFKDPTAVCSPAIMAALWKRLDVELHEKRDVFSQSQLGVEVAQRINLASFDALSFSMMASDSLVSAFHRAIKYLNAVHQNVLIKLSKENESYSMEIDVSSVSDEVPQASVDGLIALLVKLVRFLDNTLHAPLAVKLCRPKPIMNSGLDRYFGVSVHYQAEHNTLIFSKALFEKRLKTADLSVAHQNDQVVEHYIQAFEKVNIVQRVKRYVHQTLVDDGPTAEGVARELGISKRTLQRYLSAKGTTFKEILDGDRKVLAHKYLSNGIKNVADLTCRLGFSDASSFCRAFKRWYGCSTSKYSYQLRQSQRAQLNSVMCQAPISHLPSGMEAESRPVITAAT